MTVDFHQAKKYTADLEQLVRDGYKKTEMGIIPDDWKIKKIEDLFDFLSTSNCSRSDLNSEGDAYYIHYGDIHTKWNFILDFNKEDVPKIELKKVKTATPLVDGDLIFVDASEDEEGSGKAIELKNVKDRIAVAGLHTIAIRSKTEELANGFKTYIQEIPSFKKQIKRVITGIKVYAISKSNLAEVKIPLPPLPEQRAIAEALSDVDGLIAALDKLIAKKKAIKQAAMQQLLTGKLRLPGFSGEWVLKKLGDIAKIKTGDKNNEDKVEDGIYPFFVRSETVERINSYSYDCEAILVPGEGKIGEIFHYVVGRFDVHQRVYAITNFSPEVNGKYVFYYMMQNFGDWALKNTVKATVDSLRLPTFENFEIRIPESLEEQKAIASVISDIDAEIQVLERRREKVKQIKQGMMQQLLTGRVRLVKK